MLFTIYFIAYLLLTFGGYCSVFLINSESGMNPVFRYREIILMKSRYLTLRPDAAGTASVNGQYDGLPGAGPRRPG